LSVEGSALNVERSAPKGAVFLSYASQDAEAAKRIADVLRAAGVEVWFDQNELVGGDAWDAKIRRQIGSCALLLPIISASTQARREGYFRLEWRLAVERMRQMDDDLPFLLPVVIDRTKDAEAFVPDRFRETQWTRLPGGETTPAFVARVQKLLGGSEMEPGRSRPGSEPRGEGAAPPRKKFNPWLVAAIVAVAVVAGSWQLQRNREKVSAAAVPPVSAEVARIRARIIPDRWQKQDYEVVSSLLDRLLQANPEDADAWALRSISNSLQVTRNQDAGTAPLNAGKAAAERSLRLLPGNPLGEIALGLHHVTMISRGGDVQAARMHIERGVAGLPPDVLTRYAELVSYWLAFQFEDTERCARAWLAVEPTATFPAWILGQMYLAARQPAEAVQWAERAAGDHDVTGVRALATMFEVRYYLQADLPAARAALERQAAGGRTVHRTVFARWLLAMAERRWDLALQELARLPEPILFDRNYHGPKALLAGLAQRAAGRPEAMAAQFRESERLAREELARDPENEELHAVLALTLACTGRAAEARAELAMIEPLLGGRAPNVYAGQPIVLVAQTHAELGEPAKTAPWLRKLFVEPSIIVFTPASLRLDPRFAGVVGTPDIQALLAEFAALDQPVARGTGDGGQKAAPMVDHKSVAVLAFANLSDDKNNEYFSDGISEELLNVLAKVPGLKVSARTSAFYFKGKEVPVPEIARQLGVAYVVEGSVRKAGDKVRITAQLIKAADGFHVWSDTFTRDIKDVFAVQDEIAGLIAQSLSLKLGTSSLQKVAAVNPQAFELYAQARQAWSLRTPEGFARAEQMLKRSLELAPDFVRAQAALLDVVQMRSFREGKAGNFGQRNSPEIDQTLAQVRAVLALEPELAEAYSTLGQTLDSKWQREEAGRAYRRATELNPNYATGRHWYGMHLAELGQMDEALAELKAACDLDPFSFIILDNYGWLLNLAGRNREAVRMLDRAAALNPGFDQTARAKATALAALGRAAEAQAIARQLKNSQRELDVWSLGLVGLHDEANALLQRMEPGDVTTHYQAFLAAGQREAALEALADLSGVSKGGVIDLLYQRIYDPVRTEPRFVQFLAKLGLTEAHTRAQAWRRAHPPEKPEEAKQ